MQPGPPAGRPGRPSSPILAARSRSSRLRAESGASPRPQVGPARREAARRALPSLLRRMRSRPAHAWWPSRCAAPLWRRERVALGPGAASAPAGGPVPSRPLPTSRGRQRKSNGGALAGRPRRGPARRLRPSPPRAERSGRAPRLRPRREPSGAREAAAADAASPPPPPPPRPWPPSWSRRRPGPCRAGRRWRRRRTRSTGCTAVRAGVGGRGAGGGPAPRDGLGVRRGGLTGCGCVPGVGAGAGRLRGPSSPGRAGIPSAPAVPARLPAAQLRVSSPPMLVELHGTPQLPSALRTARAFGRLFCASGCGR